MWFLVHSDFFGMQYQNHFDSAGQRNRSRWERELQFFFVVVFIISTNNSNLSLEVSELRQWLPIRAYKSFHRCVLCSNFRCITLFDFIILFCVLAFTVFVLWGRYLDREVRKTILVRHQDQDR